MGAKNPISFNNNNQRLNINNDAERFYVSGADPEFACGPWIRIRFRNAGPIERFENPSQIKINIWAAFKENKLIRIYSLARFGQDKITSLT